MMMLLLQCIVRTAGCVHAAYFECDDQAGGGAVGISDNESALGPTLHSLLVWDDVEVRRVHMRDQNGHS